MGGYPDRHILGEVVDEREEGVAFGMEEVVIVVENSEDVRSSCSRSRSEEGEDTCRVGTEPAGAAAKEEIGGKEGGGLWDGSFARRADRERGSRRSERCRPSRCPPYLLFWWDLRTKFRCSFSSFSSHRSHFRCRTRRRARAGGGVACEYEYPFGSGF